MLHRTSETRVAPSSKLLHIQLFKVQKKSKDLWLLRQKNANSKGGYGKFGPFAKYTVYTLLSSLTISVVRDGDDPLRPVPELGVRYDQRDDDREDDEGGAHHVDN